MVEQNACYGSSSGHAVGSVETLADRALKLSADLQVDAEKFISECQKHDKKPEKVIEDFINRWQYEGFKRDFISQYEKQVFAKVMDICYSGKRMPSWAIFLRP